jgi:hypothetical protein
MLGNLFLRGDLGYRRLFVPEHRIVADEQAIRAALAD